MTKKKTINKPETVLVLRTCAANMTSYQGFKWPKSGKVSAPDWKPTKTCGNGLHGLPWGEGNGSLLNWADDAKWLVVEVAASEIVVIDDAKVKFPGGVVVHCGDRKSATDYIAEHGAAGKAIVGGTATAGDGGTATAGDRGILNIRWWDGERYRISVFYVGENKIKPNTAYRVNLKGEFEEVK